MKYRPPQVPATSRASPLASAKPRRSHPIPRPADLDSQFFAFIVANLAGRMLARACGNEAQAAALVDITELIWDRARTATLHLDLGSLAGFRLLISFGLGLGFPLEPCGVFAAGLPFGLLSRDALGGLVGPR